MLTTTVNKAWSAMKSYRTPPKHRELEEGFHYLMHDLRTDREHKPETRLQSLNSSIEELQPKYKRGMVAGAAMFFLGTAAVIADSYFDIGISQYSKHIPEILLAFGGLVHTIRNFSLYLDTMDYKNEMDSAVNALVSGPRKIK